MTELTPRERVLAALRGEALDRTPFALWRHFYDVEGQGARPLAEATIRWTREHGFDLVKYNPRAHYHAEPWGTAMRYEGDDRPVLVRHAVSRAEDWERIAPVPPTAGVFSEMLEGLRLVRRALGEIPLLMTIFTPLAILERLAGRERLQADMGTHPARILGALGAVTDTFCAFARACVEAGCDGIFLATTSWARRDVTTDEDYARFGRPFDLAILDAVAGAPLNVLHVCGDRARVLELADYPVAAVSWNVRAEATPSLGEFRARVTDRTAIGGISDAALLRANGLARGEAASALAQTGGRRWIAAGGCTVPPESSPRAIADVRETLAREGAWTR